MKKFLILLALFLFSALLFSQQTLIIRLENPQPDVVNHFNNLEYDIASYRPGEYLDLVVDETEFLRLRSQGFDFRLFQTEAEMAANLVSERGIPGYRTYALALVEMQQMVTNYPEICKLYNFGPSRGKQYFNAGNNNYINYQHDIWALKLSADVEQNLDKPAIFYMGAHHAREPLSTEVTFYVLNHLLQNYGTDPEITNSINTKEIWFVPIVNPDGHRIVLEQINVSWRKNIRDNDGNGMISSGSGSNWPDGVDLNRNYDWVWGGQGSSGVTTSQIYRGPSPFSEPECHAMSDLMYARHFVAGITYHTYSELVLWPYGYINNAVASDAIALSELGIAMAQTIPRLSSGYYTPQPSWALYPAAGVTDDYAYGKHGIFCYTIELANQFIPPASQVLQVCEDNLEAALILLNRIDKSTLTGRITDAITGEPLVAEIFVNGIDNTGLYREPYRSNEAFGRYYRMLPVGNYTVTFSANNYSSQTFKNVSIHDLGQTLLNVELVHEDDNVVTGFVNEGQDTCYDAVKTLLVSDFVVENGATAHLIAGTNAILKPGVEAFEGSYLSVRISDVLCSQPETLLASDGSNIKARIAQNRISDKTFKVYPNPTSGKFRIELAEASSSITASLEILNMIGSPVLKTEITDRSIKEVDLSHLPSGIYLIRIIYGEKLNMEKIIKQ